MLNGDDNSSSSFSVIDFSDLDSDVGKANDSSLGQKNIYTAKTNLLKGQPVSLDIDNNNVITVKTPTAQTQAYELVGVAISDCVAGEDVQILSKGFTTIRRTSIYPQTTIALVDDPNEPLDVLVNGSITFTGSGGSSNYSNSENNIINFDAGSGGTFTLTFNSFNFEAGQYSHYDKLILRTSRDGVNYSEVRIPWFQTMRNTSLSTTSFFGSAWNSTGSDNGYVLPKDSTRAILLGWDQRPLSINSRYLQFQFYSDSSSTDTGWNITLTSSNPDTGGSENAVVGNPLYLDTTDFTKVADASGSLLVGYVAGRNADNDSVYCYLKK